VRARLWIWPRSPVSLRCQVSVPVGAGQVAELLVGHGQVALAAGVGGVLAGELLGDGQGLLVPGSGLRGVAGGAGQVATPLVGLPG
jgi:hypothetical protein